MFDLTKMFEGKEDYHIVELHGDDDAFGKAVIDALEAAGYVPYATSVRETSTQYAFVTKELREVLHERFLESDRNSAGFMLNNPEIAAKVKEITDGIKQNLG